MTEIQKDSINPIETCSIDPKCPFNAYIERLNLQDPDRAREVIKKVCGPCIKMAENNRGLEIIAAKFMQNLSTKDTSTIL
ncbi:MAG TPA: hypothetical protein VLE44_00405 [Candidatus Saccharimonadales bacterium]|nr:hypothetical protein [Candidatus Saccharimonadales bacterium]